MKLKAALHSNRKMIGLLVILVGLVLADGLLSQFLVSQGLGQEANRLVASWITRKEFLLVKTMAGITCAAILWDTYKRKPRLTWVTSSVLVTAYCGILFWNLFVFLTASI